MKHKSIKIMLCTFAVLFIGDVISTLMLKDYIQYLELNPLHSKIGVFGIILINALLIVLMYFYYKKGTVRSHFIAIHMLVVFCSTRIFTIYNNIKIYLNPPPMEVLQQITGEVKRQLALNYLSIGLVVALLPYILGIISFYIFSIDHEIEEKKT